MSDVRQFDSPLIRDDASETGGGAHTPSPPLWEGDMSGYFVPANIERLKITHTERSLLSIIVGICKASATGTFYGSDKYLADRLDVSERQVRRMLETFTE